jgi:large subunit ribosomal protein L7e
MKKDEGFLMEAEPKVALLVRIRGVNKLAPKPKKILQLLRLR